MRRTLVGIAALALSAAPALAGLADSPIPVLGGQKTLHLYSVPGVLNDGGSTLVTLFSCTSTASSPQTVGIEVFAAAGGAPLNNALTTAQVVQPGASVTFGTQSVFSQFTDAGLGLVGMKGSARILATSKLLLCTAWGTDSGSSNPVSGWELAVIAKVKQKGD